MSFTLTMMEFILLIFGAIVVGVTFHLFISGRRKKAIVTNAAQAVDEWQLKYATDMETKSKEISSLQQQLRDAEEKVNMYFRETETLRRQNTLLDAEIEKLKKKAAEMEKESDENTPPLTPVLGMPNKADYLDQLLFAQSRLMEQNEKISQVLGSLEILKEREEKQRQILRDNAELATQINKMKGELTDKEKEINSMKQKEHLTMEMASMLDTAHSEFNTLQQTIQKLESKLTASKITSLEYEDIKDEYSRLTKELEAYREKTTSLTSENQQLHQELTSIKEKFKEADFHRQQLQKRINYLGELNSDLQLVADANKKLEGQLKQIGKLESMLNIIAEEKSGYLHPGSNQERI